MCGIAGLLKFEGRADAEDVACVRRMTESLRHRGPDGSGLVRRGPAVLGHRRLSIIDLSEAGSQPMSNEDETVWLIFNGEIYNFADLRRELLGRGHLFRSQTDSESLLHGYEEWGLEGVLNRLRGMFAFVLLDTRRGGFKLSLARDRFGIKPLYYWTDGGQMVFSSELRAFAHSGRFEPRTDPLALLRFFQLGSVPEPLTIWRDVRALPAGASIVFEGASSRTRQYYRLSDALEKAEPEPAPPTADKAEERVRAILERSVDLHLVSDAPLGVFLSGGVDSSSLAALASRRVGGRLNTVSVIFGEAEFSEVEYLREMADLLKSRHREIMVREGDFLEALPAFFRAQDQPSVDGLNSYFVARAARDAGLKAVLSGLGGDELFFGYRHFRSGRRFGSAWSAFKKLPRAGRRWSVKLAAAMGAAARKGALDRADYLSGGRNQDFYLLYRGLLAPRQIRELLGLTAKQLEEAGPPLDEPAGGALLRSLALLEFDHYLKNQTLRDADVMSMAHSIEVRVPFLDHRLVEEVLGLPDGLKFDGRVNKPLLVRAMGPDLPRKIWDRPKMGFTFPIARWLKGKRTELREDWRPEGLDRKALDRIWSGFEAGRVHWSQPWATLVASKWA